MPVKEDAAFWSLKTKQSWDKIDEDLTLSDKFWNLNLEQKSEDSQSNTQTHPSKQSPNRSSEIIDLTSCLNLSTKVNLDFSVIKSKFDDLNINQKAIKSQSPGSAWSEPPNLTRSQPSLNPDEDASTQPSILPDKNWTAQVSKSPKGKSLFKSKADEDFVFKVAPSVMKKLLITQSGWKIYTASKYIKFAESTQLQLVIDPEAINKQYSELMADKAFAISFTRDSDKYWLKRCLARPISAWDSFGYVYVYYVKQKQDRKLQDKAMPFKIGRSVNCPKRISHSEKENKEMYNVAITEPSQYYKHFEAIVHDYFRSERIIRTEIKDGKTEWFYKKFSDIARVIKMCKVYLKVVHNDKAEPRKGYMVKD